MSGFKDVSCLLTLFLKPGYFLKRWYIPLLSSFLTSFYRTITKTCRTRTVRNEMYVSHLPEVRFELKLVQYSSPESHGSN